MREDGEIVYEGSHKALDTVFPPDGIIRIRKAPPMISGEQTSQMQAIISHYNCPILKKRVLLKPKKLRLPKPAENLGYESFSDVLYDSATEGKVKRKP